MSVDGTSAAGADDAAKANAATAAADR